MESLQELKQFLSRSSRLDLKSVTLTHFLSLTGTLEGKNLIIKCPEILTGIIDLSLDDAEVIAKDAVLVLINIASVENGAEILLKTSPSNEKKTGLIQLSLRFILDQECTLSDCWCMLLSNLSRPEHLISLLINELDGEDNQIEKLVTSFTRVGYNNKKAHLDHLGPIFSNISQHPRGRELLCKPGKSLVQRILPFTHHQDSVKRRGGAIGLVKNICFDTARHDWLLSEEIDVLPFILLPLAGPEEFDDEDNEMLPTELQYLGPDKTREEDPDLRKMLLESLAQLCATKTARQNLRKRGTYEILRELHKWEIARGKDLNRRVLLACENVVDVLIRTEDEIGKENLKDMDVPDDLLDRFETMDKEFLEEDDEKDVKSKDEDKKENVVNDELIK